jgi:hypothetical protein
MMRMMRIEQKQSTNKSKNMTTEEIIRLIISFLGGGVVSGIINWIRTLSSEKNSRRVDYLENQIANLYGPLYFFTTQADEMFKLSRKFLGAYNAEYVNQEWSRMNILK